jgi:hypothetical protein
MNRPFPHQSPTRENDLRQPELRGEQRRATADAIEAECPAAILYDLHSLIGEVQQFLMSFCDNWQQAQAEPRANLEKIAEEPQFSDDRTLPPSQSGLSEQAASLTEAWLRLEAEQREMLQAKASESQTTEQPLVQKKPEKPTLQRRKPPQKLTASMPDHQMLSEFQLMRQEIVAARTITTAR